MKVSGECSAEMEFYSCDIFFCQKINQKNKKIMPERR